MVLARPICVITEPDWMPEDALARLEREFELVRGPFSPDDLREVIASAHGAFVGLDHTFEAELLPSRLQFIASPTTGLNHIDLEDARAKKIEILSLKGELDFLKEITATSELCWGLILALTRQIPKAHDSVVAGEWDRDRFISHELKESTLGIIGLGRLGLKVASYAKAFDMRVLGCSAHDAFLDDVETTSLESVLRYSDIVSLHADSRPENHHMMGAEQFAMMKKGAAFINTARGDLVDEAALLVALQSGHLSGAALDVLEEEFSDSHSSQALKDYAKSHDNLLLTPHIGGVTYESQYRTTHFTIDKLLSWWQDKQG